MKQFVHLHVHSEFSLLDGLARIDGLVRRAKEQGSPALALTDHGAMYGVVKFYKKANKEEIKPIIGCELYMSAGDLNEKKRKDAFHLTVWALDVEGYRNLMKLVTIGQVEGFYYKPRVDMDVLAKYAKGLAASTGCPAGLVARQLMEKSYAAAKKTAKSLGQIFGSDNLFVELQRHPFGEFAEDRDVPEKIRGELKDWDGKVKKLEQDLIRLSRELGLPLLATNDVHYVEKEDAVAQDAIVCIQTGKMIADLDRMRYVDTPTYYLKTPEEMAKAFEDLPEAIENSARLAERVDCQIKLGEWFFPSFKLPKGKTAGETLQDMSYGGAERLFSKLTDEIKERLDYELKIIDDRGFSPYFLIFADLTRFCRENEIYINTRGSAAGSLVSYCCGITTVDPLRYNLPFERFLNPFRPSPPDIDLDVSDERREDVIAYLKKKYGDEKVAQICTFGTMQARASVRDVGRVMGMPYSQPDRIAKMIPMGLQGFPMFLDRALKETPDLKKAYDQEDDTKKLIDLAKKIEGNSRHISVHAAAVVVSPTELTDFTPLQREPGGGEKIITQYEMHACEDVGLIKLDVLGIRNLSIMANAIRIIQERGGEEIDIYRVALDDKKTFEMLAKGHTFGVFQLASAGMTRYLIELKPERVEDLMHMVALYRPGPMAFIPDYIRRRHNPSLVTYLDPRMENILKDSYGVIVYQDDVLSLALELAGYDWDEVDKFRKAIGKKIPGEMEAQKEKFIIGCIENGMKEKIAKELFAQIETFAAYGFNKAHAASYGLVSYWTAYLKANYPVEYMTALLTAESGNTEKMVEAINECDRMGITILPPDINESGPNFTIVEADKGKAIRFGLSAIKNVGVVAVEAILGERKKDEFAGLTDFCIRVDQRKVNKKVLESLIKAGAFDRFGKRAALIAALEQIKGKTAASQKERESGQQSLFSGEAKGVNLGVSDNLPQVEDWPNKEMLKYEKELLGFYLSNNPVKEVMKKVEPLISHRINQLDTDSHLGQTVTVAGLVAQVRQVYTKKSNAAMAFGRIEDDTGSMEVVLFPSVYESCKELWVADQPVLVTGKVDNRDESLSLIVDEVQNVEGLKAAERRRIEVKRGTDLSILQEISRLLKNNPGETVVSVSIPNGGDEPKIIELPFGVDFSDEVMKKIEELLS